MPWFVAVGVVLFICLPLLLYLAKGAAHPSAAMAAPGDQAPTGLSRSQVLRDPGFYRLLPAALAVPFTVTAILFHQSAIADLRDWPAERIAMAFIGFLPLATWRA